jgi:hypothetical protein
MGVDMRIFISFLFLILAGCGSMGPVQSSGYPDCRDVTLSREVKLNHAPVCQLSGAPERIGL